MLLRDQMKIIEEHQKAAPVKVTPIAEALGVSVYRSTLPPEISGMIRRDAARGGDSGFAIYVNSAHSNVRKRFTIAHEIAHYILHESLIGDGIVEDALLRSDGLSNRIEAQANALAADILMPWHLITECQEKGIESIEGLAAAFDVSKDAMSIRLIGMSYSRARELERA